ncbi:VOC family protein [Agrobacterium sp. RAC06]|uniref:VOC family protein n=1 Tax=Agrobacterium sp. RAC06 TaxID=1842536 RepID=UPI00083DABE2|nr:VOC family protein [Agrobacterium sp. RAC06]AOG09713.1 glyoxalase-like domain protein [Agrobacterium sp. RAC06]
MSGNSLFLVSLVVDTYDRAKAFYCDGLGFECMEDTQMPDGKRWLVVRPIGSEGASLLLAEASNDAQRAAIGNQAGGCVGFFLKTDDFARDQARFVKAGVVFQEAPRQEVYGTVAVFHDLYGNLWDLIEPAPADPSVSAKVTA